MCTTAGAGLLSVKPSSSGHDLYKAATSLSQPPTVYCSSVQSPYIYTYMYPYKAAPLLRLLQSLNLGQCVTIIVTSVAATDVAFVDRFLCILIVLICQWCHAHCFSVQWSTLVSIVVKLWEPTSHMTSSTHTMRRLRNREGTPSLYYIRGSVNTCMTMLRSCWFLCSYLM